MRFNTNSADADTGSGLTRTARQAQTTNYEGGEAYDPGEWSPRLTLAMHTIGNLLEDTYYRSDTDALLELDAAFRQAVAEDPEWPLKTAAYARDEHYLRDVSQVLLVLSANTEETKPYVRDYAPHIIQRADEPMTLCAIHDELFDTPLPPSLRKAIQDALNTFDDHQLAKWDRPNREKRLRDVINRVHPEAYDDQHAVWFKQVTYGELDDYPQIPPLDTPETWETVLTEQGNTREAWESVLPKMGLVAITRNLRNMLEAGVDAETILDELSLEGVNQSKVYPFRFYQAWRALEPNRNHRTWSLDQPTVALNDRDKYLMKNWLSDAADIAAGNIPDALLDSDTAVFADTSGSMYHALSKHSSMLYADIAAFFAGVFSTAGATVGAFADEVETLNEFHSDGRSTFHVADAIEQLDVGGGTNGWKVLRTLTDEGIATDRVVLLTDMQMWNTQQRLFALGSTPTSVREEWDRYTTEVAPDSRLYLIDLASYGDLSVPDDYDNVYQLGGWNDSLVDWVVNAENPDVMLEEIEAREPVEMTERKAAHVARWGGGDN